MKKIMPFVVLLSLLYMIACDNDEKSDKDVIVKLYQINIFNNSDYVITDFLLDIVDKSGLSPDWEIDSIGTGETTDYHSFFFVEAGPGELVPGNYGCYQGDYIQNEVNKEILICYPDFEELMTITIDNDSYSF
jgi:hypothetical protein